MAKEKTLDKSCAVETPVCETEAAADQNTEIQKEFLFAGDMSAPCAPGGTKTPEITNKILIESEINDSEAAAARQIRETFETKKASTNVTISNHNASQQSSEVGTVFDEEKQKACTPKHESPARMAVEGEQAAPAQRSRKKSSKKKVVQMYENAEMSTEEKFEIKSKSVKATASKLKLETNKIDDETLEGEKKDSESGQKYIGTWHPHQLFVVGIKMSTNKSTLSQHFSKYGKVAKVARPFCKSTGKNKGYAFVYFESAASLQSALGDVHEVDGKKIKVKMGKNSVEMSAISGKAGITEGNSDVGAVKIGKGGEENYVEEQQMDDKTLNEHNEEAVDGKGESAGEAERETEDEEKVDAEKNMKINQHEDDEKEVCDYEEEDDAHYE